jgi:hypothetical protein
MQPQITSNTKITERSEANQTYSKASKNTFKGICSCTAFGSVVGWGTMLQAGRMWVREYLDLKHGGQWLESEGKCIMRNLDICKVKR